MNNLGSKNMSYMDNLINLRKSRGLTQAEIANVLNTSTQYYQKYEKGKHPLPVEHLITLCKFYHVSSDSVLGLDVEK